MPFAAITLVVAAAIVFALRHHPRTAVITAGAFAVWLTLIGAIAATGFFSDFDARPPRLPFVVVGAFVLFALLTRARAFGALPRHLPIALQTMRVPIELALYALAVQHRLPQHLTFEGRNFDVLVGLTAPVVAWLVARHRLPTAAVVGWHLASLALLANIVFMAVTSIPGPLHLNWPGEPNTVVAEFPVVWLPGFLVPTALFAHVVSLRQWLSLRRQPASAASPASAR